MSTPLNRLNPCPNPTTSYWKNKKVLVTGASGFIGKHLTARLHQLQASIHSPSHAECDLLSWEKTHQTFQRTSPDYVIHLAGYQGGLGVVLTEPGRLLYDNLVMGLHLIEACRYAGVRKLVIAGSGLSYPPDKEGPLKEIDFWSGPMHETESFYGHAKKMLQVAGCAYRRQYGLHSIHLLLGNVYGPGDCFDEYRSHLAATLIHKFVKAQFRNSSVELSGTGAPKRDFVFIEDAVTGILLAAEKYDQITPLNIGSGQSVSIRTLANLIAEELKFKGDLVWDAGRPEVPAVAPLEISRLKQSLGWQPTVPLYEGIRKTIHWYLENHQMPLLNLAA